MRWLRVRGKGGGLPAAGLWASGLRLSCSHATRRRCRVSRWTVCLARVSHQPRIWNGQIAGATTLGGPVGPSACAGLSDSLYWRAGPSGEPSRAHLRRHCGSGNPFLPPRPHTRKGPGRGPDRVLRPAGGLCYNRSPTSDPSMEVRPHATHPVHLRPHRANGLRRDEPARERRLRAPRPQDRRGRGLDPRNPRSRGSGGHDHSRGRRAAHCEPLAQARLGAIEPTQRAGRAGTALSPALPGQGHSEGDGAALRVHPRGQALHHASAGRTPSHRRLGHPVRSGPQPQGGQVIQAVAHHHARRGGMVRRRGAAHHQRPARGGRAAGTASGPHRAFLRARRAGEGIRRAHPC